MSQVEKEERQVAFSRSLAVFPNPSKLDREKMEESQHTRNLFAWLSAVTLGLAAVNSVAAVSSYESGSGFKGNMSTSIAVGFLGFTFALAGLRRRASRMRAHYQERIARLSNLSPN